MKENQIARESNHVKTGLGGISLALLLLSTLATESPAPEPTRFVIECEDLQGVGQDYSRRVC